MKKLNILLVLLVVAACSKSPKDRLIENCKADATAEKAKGCECIGEKLESKISPEQYELLVNSMESGKKNQSQEDLAKAGIEQSTTMAFLGAVKECEGIPAPAPSAAGQQ